MIRASLKLRPPSQTGGMQRTENTAVFKSLSTFSRQKARALCFLTQLYELQVYGATSKGPEGWRSCVCRFSRVQLSVVQIRGMLSSFFSLLYLLYNEPAHFSKSTSRMQEQSQLYLYQLVSAGQSLYTQSPNQVLLDVFIAMNPRH